MIDSCSWDGRTAVPDMSSLSTLSIGPCCWPFWRSSGARLRCSPTGPDASCARDPNYRDLTIPDARAEQCADGWHSSSGARNAIVGKCGSMTRGSLLGKHNGDMMLFRLS